MKNPWVHPNQQMYPYQKLLLWRLLPQPQFYLIWRWPTQKFLCLFKLHCLSSLSLFHWPLSFTLVYFCSQESEEVPKENTRMLPQSPTTSSAAKTQSSLTEQRTQRYWRRPRRAPERSRRKRAKKDPILGISIGRHRSIPSTDYVSTLTLSL
jgi:hypothetical protein